MARAIVDVDQFTSPVMVPEAGDDRTAASVQGGFQALTNRTLNLKNTIEDGLAGYSDLPHVWTDTNEFSDILALSGTDNELSYQPLPRTRRIILPPTLACPRAGAAIKLAGAGVSSPFCWYAEELGSLVYTFRLPHGAMLQRVRVSFEKGLGAEFSVHVYQVEAIVGGINTGATVKHDLGVTSKVIAGTVADVITHVIPAPVATNGQWHFYALDIFMAAIGAGCGWPEIEFLDPGPRNF